MHAQLFPASRPPAASVVNVSKIYGDAGATVRALDDVTVRFAGREFTAIMGPSGSGKSTLLHTMAGLETPTAGTINLAGSDITSLSDKELTRLRRDRLGFIFQTFNLLPSLTALENITLPLSLARRKPDPAWLELILETVDLGHRLSHRPAQMSGGQQQRVAAARALVAQPEMVFADEPTGALDSKAAASLLAFMRSAVHDLGQTIIMVTHDPIAASYADRVVFLADGRVVHELDTPTRDSVIDCMKSLGG